MRFQNGALICLVVALLYLSIYLSLGGWLVGYRQLYLNQTLRIHAIIKSSKIIDYWSIGRISKKRKHPLVVVIHNIIHHINYT